MITNISTKIIAMVAGLIGLLFMGCQEQLEVRTFDLEQLRPSEAEALITPYVYPDRPRAPGMLSRTDNVLTVRELPENLDRIEAVLRRYDQPALDLQLRFQLIEANGYAERDAAIAEVENELRGLLRYEGYRLASEAIVQVRDGEAMTQRLVLSNPNPERNPFTLELRAVVRGVSVPREGSAGPTMVELIVGLGGLGGLGGRDLLETQVRVAIGQTMVLGTTSLGIGDNNALILVVTPHLN